MANRGWRDIVAHLLEIARQPINKTAIMYSVSFSYTNLCEYLALTEKSGLLAYDADSGKYQTTSKGLEFLRLYQLMNELVLREGMLIPPGLERG